MGGRLLDLRNQFLEDEFSHLLPETAIANRLQREHLQQLDRAKLQARRG